MHTPYTLQYLFSSLSYCSMHNWRKFYYPGSYIFFQFNKNMQLLVCTLSALDQLHNHLTFVEMGRDYKLWNRQDWKQSSRRLFKVFSGNVREKLYKSHRPEKNRTGYVPLYCTGMAVLVGNDRLSHSILYSIYLFPTLPSVLHHCFITISRTVDSRTLEPSTLDISKSRTLDSRTVDSRTIEQSTLDLSNSRIRWLAVLFAF
jgi:hypothetical protein